MYTRRYISPICPEGPVHDRRFTKFVANVRLVDVINCEEFWDNPFKGFDFTPDRNSIFSAQRKVIIIIITHFYSAVRS